MATGGLASSLSGHTVTSSTDCPQCGCLCLGPVALSCGHVICRRCLHDVQSQLGHPVSCQQCGQRLNLPEDRNLTVSQLAELLGTDPVMEERVNLALNNITDVPCLNCPNVQAEKVCLDCQEYYCDICSVNHCRSRSSKDHVLYPLSRALPNASTSASAASTPKPRPSSPSIKSTSSSIRNPALPQSRDTNRGTREWNGWVKNQMSLMEGASGEMLSTKTILDTIVSFAQELSNRVCEDEQNLDDYKHTLPRFDVTQRKDEGTYVIRSKGSTQDMIVKTESLEKCLRHVMQGRHCHHQDALRTICAQLDQLLHPAAIQPPILGERNSRSLRDLLMPSAPPALPCDVDPGCHRCSKKCAACRLHLMETTGFSSDRTGERFTIRHNLGCGSTNVIYMLFCELCRNTQYVGETKNSVSVRITLHRFHIRHNIGTLVAEHFNLAGHSFENVRCIILEQLFVQSKKARLRREKFWKDKLKTMTPLGLNSR